MTEEEKKAIERLYSSVTDVMFNILYSREECDKDIKTVLNLIQNQQSELEKKNRIINEMAGYISNITECCPNENCGVNLDCENRCSTDDDLVDVCWKQYFERLCEDVKNKR